MENSLHSAMQKNSNVKLFRPTARACPHRITIFNALIIVRSGPSVAAHVICAAHPTTEISLGALKATKSHKRTHCILDGWGYTLRLYAIVIIIITSSFFYNFIFYSKNGKTSIHA